MVEGPSRLEAQRLTASTDTVGGLMPLEPIQVWPDTDISDVAELMDRSGISGVPVVDSNGYLVGIITTTDLLRVRASESLLADWSRLRASHVMSQPGLTLTVDVRLDDALRLMERRGVHRLVVVADDGESPIGVLSATELVLAMADNRLDRRR
jgi:CBS domain-containing protein